MGTHRVIDPDKFNHRMSSTLDRSESREADGIYAVRVGNQRIPWEDIELTMRAQAASMANKSIDLTDDEKRRVILTAKLLYNIYFLAAPDAGLIKIGRTTKLKQRMLTLSAQCPIKLTLVASVKYDRDFEQRLHRYFNDIRSHGEWFYAESRLLDYIRTLKSDPKTALELVDAWCANIDSQ